MHIIIFRCDELSSPPPMCISWTFVCARLHVHLNFITCDELRPRLHVNFNFYTWRTLIPASMHILTSITRDELSSLPPCTFELLYVTNWCIDIPSGWVWVSDIIQFYIQNKWRATSLHYLVVLWLSILHVPLFVWNSGRHLRFLSWCRSNYRIIWILDFFGFSHIEILRATNQNER